MTERLSGRVAAVTGAARGNGRAFAEAFLQEGARVALVDIDEDALSQTVSDLAAADAMAIVANVALANDAELMVQRAVANFGQLDIFVNNAGVIGRVGFLDLGEDEWDRVLNVNLKGSFLCGQAAARQMVQQASGGSIINVASVNAESVNATTVHYCVSKGGVRTLTKAMALALAPDGVRVNAIAPGPVYTALSRDRLDDPDARAAVLAHIPLGRVAQPADLQGAAIFLASDDSAFVTGTVLYVDGGWLTI